MAEQPRKKINLQVRITNQYNDFIKELEELILKYNFTYCETIGLLEMMKSEVFEDYAKEE